MSVCDTVVCIKCGLDVSYGQETLLDWLETLLDCSNAFRSWKKNTISVRDSMYCRCRTPMDTEEDHCGLLCVIDPWTGHMHATAAAHGGTFRVDPDRSSRALWSMSIFNGAFRGSIILEDGVFLFCYATLPTCPRQVRRNWPNMKSCCGKKCQEGKKHCRTSDQRAESPDCASFPAGATRPVTVM